MVLDYKKIIEKIAELLEKANDVNDSLELANDLKDKLEQILESLEKNPKIITTAELLVCLIETLGEKMPPVMSDFIKMYATALKSGINAATFLTCIRYNMLRKDRRLSHAEACKMAFLSSDNCIWCHLR